MVDDQFKRDRLFHHLVHEDFDRLPGRVRVACEEGWVFQQAARRHDTVDAGIGDVVGGVGEGEYVAVGEGGDRGVRDEGLDGVEVYGVGGRG